MADVQIDLLGWKISPEEEHVLKSMMSYLLKKTGSKTLHYRIADLRLVDSADPGDIRLVFGEKANKLTRLTDSSPSFTHVFPEPKHLINTGKNTEYREAALKVLDGLAHHLKAGHKEVVKAHVEINKTSIGKEACDINISKEEAEYLKKLKDLLGGSKVVVTKGDIRIEVE